MILDQIADEQRGDKQFGPSQDELPRLADKVRQDIRAGRVKDMGIDEL